VFWQCGPTLDTFDGFFAIALKTRLMDLPDYVIRLFEGFENNR